MLLDKELIAELGLSNAAGVVGGDEGSVGRGPLGCGHTWVL